MANKNNDLQYITDEENYDEDEENRHLHLNDEVINTYMDLITERSPETVYAFNTFFFYCLI